MKITVCDVCVGLPTPQNDPPLRMAIWRVKGKSGVTVSLCGEHRNATKSKTDSEILNIGVKAEAATIEHQEKLSAEAKKERGSRK